MANSLPPPPVEAKQDSWQWMDWYRQLQAFFETNSGAFSWSSIDTAGSNLTDLATRNHNDLQNHDGGSAGQYYHLTSAQHGDLTDLVGNIDWATGTLTVSGDLDVTGNIEVDGTQVVTNRQTGWSAPTGTATRSSFDTTTVTTEELAEAVHALIDDLTTHGLIGT